MVAKSTDDLTKAPSLADSDVPLSAAPLRTCRFRDGSDGNPPVSDSISATPDAACQPTSSTPVDFMRAGNSLKGQVIVDITAAWIGGYILAHKGDGEFEKPSKPSEDATKASASARLLAEPGPRLVSVEAELRAKLRCLVKESCSEMLWPCVGRRDVVQHIMSFIESERPLIDTEVGGKMFQDTGSANLDFFFQSVPQGRPKENELLKGLLDKAWAESPGVCLKQMFLLGSRDGKQDRHSFYDAMMWLWHKDPHTLLANLHLVPECNYWKGLLEILACICEGPVRSLQRDLALHSHYKRCQNEPEDHKPPASTELSRKVNLARPQRSATIQKWAWYRMEDAGIEGEGNFRPGSRLQLAEEALKRYDSDPVYRSLFERIARLFAEQLRMDLAAMRRGQRVRLCAKWCPLLYHSFDRRTLLCEGIARWLFPATLPEFAGCSERQYAYRARDLLRKRLSELTEYMKLPERLICQRRWAEIRYKSLPAACLTKHAKSFEKHDSVRIASLCDVSGSMSCEAAPHISCMDVAIALSLLVAELSSGPLARQVITFHERPFMMRVDWGGSTNFHRVFQLLENIPQPPKKILVFSDMQFANAGGNTTVLRQIQRNYRQAGRTMPELVFWNLRATSGAPALATDAGVVLMSGFSSRMLKMVTESGPDPLAAFSKALENLLCGKVRVADAADAEELLGPALPFSAFTFAAEAESETAKAAEPAEPAAAKAAEAEAQVPTPKPKQQRKRRQVTVALGGLPCRVAEAALIGKGGQRIQELRKTLQDRLCQELDKGYFRFWLDVRRFVLQATVEAAETSFGEDQIRTALAQLKHSIPRSVVYNKKQHIHCVDDGLPARAPGAASATLGSLPTNRAMADFIGPRGSRIQSMKEELERILDEQLSPAGFWFYLDVQKTGVTGVLSATVVPHDSSLTEGQLVTAFQRLKAHVQRSQHYTNSRRVGEQRPTAPAKCTSRKMTAERWSGMAPNVLLPEGEQSEQEQLEVQGEAINAYSKRLVRKVPSLVKVLGQTGCGSIDGGQDERLMTTMPASPLASEGRSLLVPAYILGARRIFGGLDGTSRDIGPENFNQGKPDVNLDVPLTSDLVDIEVGGMKTKIGKTSPFLGFQSINQESGLAQDVPPARKNQNPIQFETTGEYGFEAQDHSLGADMSRRRWKVKAWYNAVALDAWHPDVQAVLKKTVQAIGSGPWGSGVWWGNSQIFALVAWIGQALAQSSWGRDMPLDYYIYSSFTENPSNQCLVHAKAACSACLAACDNSGYAGSGNNQRYCCMEPEPWIPSAGLFDGKACLPSELAPTLCGVHGFGEVFDAFRESTVGEIWHKIKTAADALHDNPEEATLFDKMLA
ncbi:unnamed protein product [Symbiodinium sp. CCMP2456]|nr:unnamed protein product [Symbiodinium sp. CCMP2456]